VRRLVDAGSRVSVASRRGLAGERLAVIVPERGPGMGQDDVRMFIQDTDATLQVVRMVQIVVGYPLEQGRSGELEDSVEIGKRAEVLFVAMIADARVAFGKGPAYL